MVANRLLENHWARDIRGTLGVHDIAQYIQLGNTTEHTTLSDEPDKL
jgi:hypothetical protein